MRQPILARLMEILKKVGIRRVKTYSNMRSYGRRYKIVLPKPTEEQADALMKFIEEHASNVEFFGEYKAAIHNDSSFYSGCEKYNDCHLIILRAYK